MPTRNIVLTDRQTRFIGRLVKTGRYQNASEVLREGMRLVERQEAENEARLNALREAANSGIADIDAGRFRSFDAPRAASPSPYGSGGKCHCPQGHSARRRGMTDRRQWRVRLTAAAAADLQNILRWTTGHFGETQARLYGDTLARALELLTEGPRVRRRQGTHRYRKRTHDAACRPRSAGRAGTSCCIAPTLMPPRRLSTSSVYCTTPWIWPVMSIHPTMMIVDEVGSKAFTVGYCAQCRRVNRSS